MRRRSIETIGMLFPALWAGMIVGVSFIATPAKFMAPSLGTRVAFDVGRVTSELFNSIEIGLAVVLLVMTLYAKRRIVTIAFAAVLLAITVIQALVVLPMLSERVLAIMAGYGVPPSNAHLFYVLMEITKTALLITIAFWWALFGFRNSPDNSVERRLTWATR